jgi:hypothetical protein
MTFECSQKLVTIDLHCFLRRSVGHHDRVAILQKTLYQRACGSSSKTNTFNPVRSLSAISSMDSASSDKMIVPAPPRCAAHNSRLGLHSVNALWQQAPNTHALAEKPVLHGDNGPTVKATTVLAMLHWLGIKPSYARPRVSDDNASTGLITLLL